MPTCSRPVVTLLVRNGPNLNLLGVREPETYGTTSLADIESNLEAPPEVTVRFAQDNSEGVLVDYLHAAHEDGIDGVVFGVVPGRWRVDVRLSDGHGVPVGACKTTSVCSKDRGPSLAYCYSVRDVFYLSGKERRSPVEGFRERM